MASRGALRPRALNVLDQVTVVVHMKRGLDLSMVPTRQWQRYSTAAFQNTSGSTHGDTVAQMIEL